MEIYYIIFGMLALLSVFGLIVGVSNDACNFLNSSIGSRAGTYNQAVSVAAIGVLLGACFSSGMMSEHTGSPNIAEQIITHPKDAILFVGYSDPETPAGKIKATHHGELVNLRAKGGQEKSELENCFDALYGVWMLRLQHKEVGKETTAALADIVRFIGLLSDYYAKERAGELDLEE